MNYDQAIKRDKSLDKAASVATWELMELRWHWTHGQSPNPDKVSMRQYARDLGHASFSTVQKYANAWQLHLDGQSDPEQGHPSDLLRLADAAPDQRVALKAVAEAQGSSLDQAVKRDNAGVAHIREQIKNLPDDEKEAVARDLARDRAERVAEATRTPTPTHPALADHERTRPKDFADTPTGVWATVMRDVVGARIKLARAVKTLRETEATVPADLATDIELQVELLILVADKVKEAAKIGTMTLSDQDLEDLLKGA